MISPDCSAHPIFDPLAFLLVNTARVRLDPSDGEIRPYDLRLALSELTLSFVRVQNPE